MTQSPIQKTDEDRFETISLLTVDKGQLNVTTIPTSEASDWVVPSALVIYVGECTESLQYYQWNDNEIPLYALLSDQQAPNKVVILESINDAKRIGLLVNGILKHRQIKISNAKDLNHANSTQDDELTFIFQTIEIEGEAHHVPDLPKLTKYLHHA